MFSAVFITSAPDLAHCPDSQLPEIAVIGRSNVGKSSLINMLTGIKGLAKTGAKPGKTELINYFLIDERWHLVDLPGYGYAKQGREKRQLWLTNLIQYLSKREQLCNILVLIDGSIPAQKNDLSFINSLQKANLPYSIIMTKSDKVSRNLLKKHIQELGSLITAGGKTHPTIISCSNTKQLGREEILDHINDIIQESESQSQSAGNGDSIQGV